MAIGFYMSGDNPKGLYGGKILPAGVVACTEADKNAYSAVGPFFEGTSTPRWTFIAGVLTALTDTRVTATWGHTPGPGVLDGNGDWAFDLEVGDAEPTVTLTLSTLAFSGDIVATLHPSQQKLKFQFVDGVVTLSIGTSKATLYAIQFTDQARFLNKVFVRVSETNLYPV